jgi:hypothetical protein
MGASVYAGPGSRKPSPSIFPFEMSGLGPAGIDPSRRFQAAFG